MQILYSTNGISLPIYYEQLYKIWVGVKYARKDTFARVNFFFINFIFLTIFTISVTPKLTLSQ